MRFLALTALLTLAACTARSPELGPPPGGAVDLVVPDREDHAMVIPASHGRIAALATTATGDTLLYGLTLSGFGPRASAAQITVKMLAGDTGWTLPRGKAVNSLQSTFLLINRSPWATATFALWAWGVNGSRLSKDSTLIGSWTVLRGPGVPPGGSIDSAQVQAVRVRPDSVTLASGKQQLFCADLLIGATWVGASNNDPACLLTPAIESDSPLRVIQARLAFAGMRLEPDRWSAYGR